MKIPISKLKKKAVKYFIKPTMGEGYIIPVTNRWHTFQFMGKTVPIKYRKVRGKVVFEIELTALR